VVVPLSLSSDTETARDTREPQVDASGFGPDAGADRPWVSGACDSVVVWRPFGFASPR